MMSWRSSLFGAIAGLSALAQLPDVPPAVRLVATVIGAVALAFLGAVTRDHAAPPPPPPVLPCDAVGLAARAKAAPLSQVEADAIQRVLCDSCGGTTVPKEGGS